jgi:hypothetical protein
MGNTNTSSSSKRDRTYSVDSAYDRRESSSPRGDESRSFEFVAGGRKKPVLCYQSSSEYGNDDPNDEYKVSLNSFAFCYSFHAFETLFIGFVLIQISTKGSTESYDHKSRRVHQ